MSVLITKEVVQVTFRLVNDRRVPFVERWPYRLLTLGRLEAEVAVARS